MVVARAYIKGIWRTVINPRRIERGRNRGRYEVSVREFTQPKNGPYREVMRRRVVDEIREVSAPVEHREGSRFNGVGPS